jgi:hypothetical protein
MLHAMCGVQVVDNWYPGAAKKDKGVLLMVTAGKEGAVTGGEGFMAVSAYRSAAAAAAAAAASQQQQLQQRCSSQHHQQQQQHWNGTT